MVFYSLFVINKSGGMILHRDFSPEAPKLSLNDMLRLVSTFHSIHAIAGRITPVPPRNGIELIETDTFRMQCYQTMTGLKFLLTADPHAVGLDAVLHNVYALYADYVLKNPFYELEMPINCTLFDQNLQRLMDAAAS
mmetsp:Transcript_32861/g.75151  ORF Transcript_32861/g.75151 Transcript_32861/m.75151 type:complete len:137 (-) Transcript_32861:42-452(-)